MAEDDTSATYFQSIAEAATTSWFTRQASNLSSEQSPAVRTESTEQGINGPITDSAAAPDGTPAQPSTLISASAPPGSPAPPSIHTSSAAALDSPATATASASASASASTASNSGRRDGEAQAQGDADIHSNITAWQSALQSLPAEFASASVPMHPLAQALIHQPTLRPVEWNQFRQGGGFVPRTSHDYSSLMIYLSGQVNPNPCRNCLLRNGPFARCVVSPPLVLALSTIRHACANCTYQNQYKKCTNEPITKQEKARSEWARSKSLIVKPWEPKDKARLRREKHREDVRHQAKRGRRYQQENPQQKYQLDERGRVSITQSLAGLGVPQGANLKSFDEKLRHVRARSPRSRRQMTAEMLQWQAAIATVQAEEPVPAPDTPFSSQVALPTPKHHVWVPPYSYPSSQPVLPSSAPAAAPAFTVGSSVSSSVRTENIGYGNHTFEAMDEDESEDEQEDDGEGTPWVRPDHMGSIIKAPR